MKIIIDKVQVSDGLQKAANILPQKTGAAYLRSIWIKAENNKVSFMATDANMEFSGFYNATIENEGIVGVQGRAFVELMKQLPDGKISLELDENADVLLVKQGRKKYKIPINDSSWFQENTPFPTENAVIWAGDFFYEVLEKIIFCINSDESADALACLYMKSVENEDGTKYIEVCGLNGHQFAIFTFTNDDLANLIPAEGILLQKKYVQELKKWLTDEEIEFNITDKRLYIRTVKGEILSLPRVTFTFPDYTTFLGKVQGSTHTLTLYKQECIDALSRLVIFNTKTVRFTNFELHADEAILYVQGQDTGSAKENLEIEYNGNLPTIAFPTKELLDVLSHFQSERLTLYITGVDGPCGIKGENDKDYKVVIMPMRANAKPVDETSEHDNENYDEDDV